MRAPVNVAVINGKVSAGGQSPRPSSIGKMVAIYGSSVHVRARVLLKLVGWKSLRISNKFFHHRPRCYLQTRRSSPGADIQMLLGADIVIPTSAREVSRKDTALHYVSSILHARRAARDASRIFRRRKYTLASQIPRCITCLGKEIFAIVAAMQVTSATRRSFTSTYLAHK